MTFEHDMSGQCPGNPDKQAISPDTGHRTPRARKDPRTCPVSGGAVHLSGCPVPSGAVSVLVRLRANYRESGKLVEAKAIERAIALIRKTEKEMGIQ